MHLVLKKRKVLWLVFILVGFVQCKSQKVTKEMPFEITEKTYFHFVGGREGSNGTTIKIVGRITTTNVDFSTLYFQNHAYKIIPNYQGDQFILVGSHTVQQRKPVEMHQDVQKEYGNEAPKLAKKIPFDLAKNEAVLTYRINGVDFYYKVTGVKQLDTVYYP